MKTFIFHGPSGSGKDTQADLLAQYLDMEKISTGNMYREMPSEGDEVAAYWAKKVFEDGLFPNGEVTYGLFNKYIERFDKNKDWLFVSIIRLQDQLAYYEEMMARIGRKLDRFVHFVLTDEVAIARMAKRHYCPTCFATYHDEYKPSHVAGVCDVDGTRLETRDDDKPAAISRRLAQYRNHIEPILKHFRDQGLLLEIDASMSVQEIHEKVIKELGLQKKG